MGIGHGGNIEESEKMLTTREVTDYCNVSKRRVWAAVASGELEYLDFATVGASPKPGASGRVAVDRSLASISSSSGQAKIIL